MAIDCQIGMAEFRLSCWNDRLTDQKGWFWGMVAINCRMAECRLAIVTLLAGCHAATNCRMAECRLSIGTGRLSRCWHGRGAGKM